MLQAIYGANWRSERGSCAAYICNLSHLASLLDPLSVPFFNPHLGGKMRLNYQDPDAGVFSSSGYGIRGMYIYIAIIADVTYKDIWVIIRSGHSATIRSVDGRSW